MTIMTKKYHSFPKNFVEVQKNVVIDFANSRPSSSNLETSMQKNIWDYIMIEVNNLSTKKKLHYHMVEQNPLLFLVKQFLRYGKSFLIPCLNTNPEFFEKSYQYISDIYDMIDAMAVPPQTNQLVSLNTTSTKLCFPKMTEKEEETAI